MSEIKEVDLPDFEDMYATVAKINELTQEKTALELRIDVLYSDVVKEVIANPVFFIKDKPASMAFIERTYFVGGLDGELLPLRDKLRELIDELEFLKMNLKLANTIVDVWRTQSANIRRIQG